MDVNGSPPYDANSYHAALRRHAQDVVAEARETVAHSKELAWILGEWKADTLMSRCAWCRRFRVGEGWLDVGRTPTIPDTRTTHTICDDCTQALRDAEVSA